MAENQELEGPQPSGEGILHINIMIQCIYLHNLFNISANLSLHISEYCILSHWLVASCIWAGMTTLRLGKSTRTRSIPPALATSSNRANIPLLISSSPSGRISTVLGVKGRRAASISWYTASSKPICRCGAARPRLSEPHAFTSLRDWVTQWRWRWQRLPLGGGEGL